MKPPIPITDPRFQYVPSRKTDLRERFKRIAEQQPQKESKQ